MMLRADTSPLERDSLQPLGDIRRLYFSLLASQPHPSILKSARAFLSKQLQSTQHMTSDLPPDMSMLPDWIDVNTEQVGMRYRQYLDARKAGGPRRYFANKSHALYFLKSVAPTKMVDGAWLYGLLDRWDDERFSALIQIYLEELGEGIPDKNHVVIYKKLLATHGCDQWDALSESHYVQGTIQLALARHAAEFLPEVIGFNLGYEQLPLHLPITAYELNELGIDAYYFTLHVTVDNAATGHARKALQGLHDALPRVADKDAFYQRVINGYKLNMLGAGTESVIGEFNLRDELLSIFKAKSKAGAQLHSDYCRVAGKTVNEWLSDPAQLPDFLNSLEQVGWIMRHQPPENSRFWKLIQGDHAEMFGVFNAYEKQVIHDWIAGDMAAGQTPRQLSYRARQRLMDTLEPSIRGRQHNGMTRSIIRDHYSHAHLAGEQRDDFNADLRLLEERLANLPSKSAAMALLTEFMSPTTHHTAPGLMATRIFTQLLGNA